MRIRATNIMNDGPCATCPDRDRDKNHRGCVECKKRASYAAGLGGMTHSVPVKLSDLRVNNNMTEDLKVCKDPDCALAGEPQPVENFGRSKSFVSSKNPEGYVSRCKACVNRKAKEMYKARKHQFKILKTRHEQGALATALDVFLDRYPDLKNDLKELAEDEMRSLENQVVFMLKRNIRNWKKYRNEM